MKVTVETNPIQHALITVGTERAARNTAASLWPNLPLNVRNAIVTLIRAGTIEDEQ